MKFEQKENKPKNVRPCYFNSMMLAGLDNNIHIHGHERTHATKTDCCCCFRIYLCLQIHTDVQRGTKVTHVRIKKLKAKRHTEDEASECVQCHFYRLVVEWNWSFSGGNLFFFYFPVSERKKKIIFQSLLWILLLAGSIIVVFGFSFHFISIVNLQNRIEQKNNCQKSTAYCV